MSDIGNIGGVGFGYVYLKIKAPFLSIICIKKMRASKRLLKPKYTFDFYNKVVTFEHYSTIYSP